MILTVDYLRSALHLDLQTGQMTWKYRHDMPGNWNTRYAGKPALATDRGDGYLSGTVAGIRVRAHRVAWALFHGEWPQSEIDHINGCPSDNRPENMRLATRSQNCMNIKGRRSGACCFKGVYWYEPLGKWSAKIWADGKTHHIGYFDNEVSAARAYDSRAVQHFGEYARTNDSMGLYEEASRVSVKDATRKRVRA